MDPWREVEVKENSMNFRQRIILSLLLYIAVHAVLHSRRVLIYPIRACAAAIRDDLILDVDDNITQTAMRRLVKLVVNGRGIEDLRGLELATNLQHLQLRSNRVVDISPLRNLKQLDTLVILDNRISDLTPIANLTELVELNARDNPISDLSPVSNLRKLKYLDLSRCNIVNIAPLAGLHRCKCCSKHK